MRTEVFMQFILPGNRDDNLEFVDKLAQEMMERAGVLALSVKMESLDDDDN